MSQPIPQPPGIPLLGNIADIDPQNGLLSLIHLSEKYGEIFKLSIFGGERYFISSVELLNEVCDEKRFCKSVSGALKQVRNGVGDGLFTAYHGEHNWEVAHRTLVPAFGPIGIRDMFDEMYDIATQLVAKWARMGSDSKISVTDDYTRLTLDSIALCAMDKRFNSFYLEQMHPFVDAMVGFLVESGQRGRRTRLESLLNRGPERQYQQNIATMKEVAQAVIAHRRANPSQKKDLLNALLFGKDPKTGERLTDESIMNNMITFLIAGHETTSGLLSFATYYLLKNPDTIRKAQDEVDKIVGKGPVTFQHLSKLPYIEAVLRETLRLQPTAPVFAVEPLPNTGPVVIGGKYTIPAGGAIGCLLPQIGRDPSVFGEDADEFRPDRMYGENFKKLPPNAWKPFGNGARGCIGRPFAWHEAILALALIIQNFNLRMADPSYILQIKQTLTIKPDHFGIYAILRDGIDPINLEKKMFAGIEDHKEKQQISHTKQGTRKSISIFYGSNSGTCEGLAQNLAGAALGHGFTATVKPLDAATEDLPLDRPIVIITASYEGNPPDNAATFVDWLQKADSNKINGAKFAVFGCGHHDWVSTFQKIPKFIDSELVAKGASRISDRGLSDVANGTVFDDFDSWQDENLWPALSDGESDVVVDGLDLKINTSSRASHLRHNVQEAVVLKNELLTTPDIPEKYHMEFKLPTNLVYDAGDYLALLPVNNHQAVSRVLTRFSLPWDASMKLSKGSHTTIPTDCELAVSAVLSTYVEINTLASRKNISTITEFAPDSIKAELSRLSSKSVLDILEAYPSIDLPFATYLSMLSPMRLRQYSISSSPLNDPTIATITYSVADDGEGHLGVATNYLKDLHSSSKAQVTIKKSHASFHLPLDKSTPVLMIAAGTGIAPFRGFIQERAAKILAGGSKNDFGEALLFHGCRYSDKDQLYHKELEKWAKIGAVNVYNAFSKESKHSKDCKYIQDRLWCERETVSRLFQDGARAYICGSSALGKGVAQVAARIFVENEEKKGNQRTLEQGLKWWDGLRGERYAVDVFD